MTTTAEKIRAIRGRLDEVVDETAGIEEIRQEVMAWIRHSLAFQSGIDLGETPPKNWLEVWELDERKNYEEAPRTELLRVDGLPTPAGAILGGRGIGRRTIDITPPFNATFPKGRTPDQGEVSQLNSRAERIFGRVWSSIMNAARGVRGRQTPTLEDVQMVMKGGWFYVYKCEPVPPDEGRKHLNPLTTWIKGMFGY